MRASAFCLVENSDKRVLLVQRKKDPRVGFWCLPGGGGGS